MTARPMCVAARAGDRVAHALGEQRAVGEARDRVVEGLVGELLLERLALGDVAAVEDDAADVLVVEQVRVQDLELAAALPSRWRSVHSRTSVPPSPSARRRRREQVQQAALLAAGEQARRSACRRPPRACSRGRARSTGSGRRSRASESSTVMRSLECADERAEARLARRRWTSSVSAALSSASDDLRGERAQAAARGRREGVARRRRRAGRASPRGRQAAGRRAWRRAAAGEVGAALGREREPRAARVGGGAEERAGGVGAAPRRRRRRRPCARRRPGAVVVDEAQRAARRPRRRATRRRRARRGRSPRASSRRRARRRRALSVALAGDGALLLADEAGHADDDEAEQDDRGADDDEQVHVAAARARGPARPPGAIERRARSAARAASGVSFASRSARRLLEAAHRRVQGGRAPEQVEADPADVEP